jgi:hypothetical protein
MSSVLNADDRTGGPASERRAAAPRTNVRIKLQLSPALLQSNAIHDDWAKIWFLIHPGVTTVGDMLPDVWAMLRLSSFPRVRVSIDGYFVPTSSPIGILREGDVVNVMLWSEDLHVPQQPGACSKHMHLPVYPRSMNLIMYSSKYIIR